MSDESSRTNSPVPKRKSFFKNKEKQKYRAVWEKLPEFKGWLTSGRNEYEAFCKLCNTKLLSQVHIIKTHSQSKSHKQHLTRGGGTRNLHQFFESTRNEKPSRLDDQVKQAEILLTGFFAEHNLAFLGSDHLTQVLRKCFPDSKIAEKMTLGRTKTTAIIKNVTAKQYKVNLVEVLKTSKFSILTDESTDISSEKTSCIVVRCFDKKQNRIVSKFWELTQVYASELLSQQGATAENLFLLIKKSFDEHDIPFANIVGFGSDGCNVMMGRQNSVASRFTDMCAGLAIMKCICHSAHLIASEACKCLPRRCEDLARNIFNFINGSSKRMNTLKQFQEFLNIDVHRILHPSQTRWLSLSTVVTRLVEQWDALKLFFNDQYLAERLVSAEHIFNDLNDPFIKLYFYFLDWVLPKFANFNKYFQAETVVVTDLYVKMVELYKEFLLLYMDPSYISKSKIEDVDPNKSTYFVNKKNMYLGVKVLQEVSKPEIQNAHRHLEDFYNRCQEFMVVTCTQIKKRFNFGDKMLPLLVNLKPQNAISQRTRTSMPSLLPLMNEVPRIIALDNVNLKQKVDDQWRRLPNAELPSFIKTEAQVDIFWAHLLNYKNILDICEFRELAQFILDILCIPHSNAQCERIFSKINLIKTKTRNKLLTNTINSLIMTSELIKDAGDCTKFEVTEECKRNHNQKMYDFKNCDDCVVKFYNLLLFMYTTKL